MYLIIHLKKVIVFIQGSTWTLFEAISEDEYKNRLNCSENFEELWKMAVQDDYTRL
jgi:hypothetical protein